MKKLLLIQFLVVFHLYAQSTTTLGTLQRINIYSNQINLKDTVETWKTMRAGSNEYPQYIDEDFLTAFTYNNKLFFVKERSESVVPGFFDSYSIYLSCPPTINKTLYSAVFGFTDIINPPNFPSNFRVYITKNGVWCLRAFTSSSFLDSTINYKNPAFPNNSKFVAIAHIPGKVGEKYILAVTTYQFQIEYYLDALNNAPSINLEQKIFFVNDNYSHEWAPQKVSQINDSLFVVGLKNKSLQLMQLKDYKFSVLKKITECNAWYYNDNSLYCFTDSSLFSLKFLQSTKEFSNKKTLLVGKTSNYVANETDGNYFYIKNDTLNIYNLFQERIINKFDIAKIKYRNLIFNSPYIFLSKISTVTDIEKKETIPKDFSLSQNYPNPFNPETTINYSIPQSEHVTLKVFDLLGQEVATLVDEYKNAGTYNVVFNVKTRHGASLQSGIYFYRLQAARYSQTKKLILVK